MVVYLSYNQTSKNMKTLQTRRNAISRLRVKELASVKVGRLDLSYFLKRSLQEGRNRY